MSHELVQKIAAAILQRELFQDRQRILVAVSGGIDSVVLLHLLNQLAPPHGWELIVAHFNHLLRGPESDADEAFVRRLAAELNLAVAVGSGDVAAEARSLKMSVEESARNSRHRFFAATSRKLGLCDVALAHHADDQVELFFMRAFRGAGTEGLGGMDWKSFSSVDSQVGLVRPLLSTCRAEIVAFADQFNIQCREDSSNDSVAVTRNRIRHRLIPSLVREFEPALVSNVCRLMEVLRSDHELVARTAADWLRTPKELAFTDLPVAVQRECLKLQLFEYGLQPEFDLIETLRRHENKPVSVGVGLNVERSKSGRVKRVRRRPDFEHDGAQVIELVGTNGAFNFRGQHFVWKVEACKRPAGLPTSTEGVERFDADAVGSPIRLRTWRRGDRFQPIGMNALVKLQDLFTNLKIPKARRHKLMVAESENGGIFWVEGVRISDSFKITPETVSVLIWRWHFATKN